MILTALVLQSVLRMQLPTDLHLAYDVTRAFRTLDGEEQTVYTEKWVYSFDKSMAGGAARLKKDVTLTAIRIDGTEMKPKPVTDQCTEERSPRGEVRGREFAGQADASLLARLARIGDIVYPTSSIAVGEPWTRETKPTDAEGLSGATWTFTPSVELDGHIDGTFAFLEAGVDDPIQAQGEFSVSTRDGWPISLSFKAATVYQPGDEERLPAVFEFTMKRADNLIK